MSRKTLHPASSGFALTAVRPRTIFYCRGSPIRSTLPGLHRPLWFGNGGVFALKELRRELTQQRQENQRLRERNLALGAEVLDLKLGLEAVEERARAELGMVRRGETFYQLVEPKAKL